MISNKPSATTTFVFGLSIIGKYDEVLLTASTGAAAANINGATYYSALGFGNNGNQPYGNETQTFSYQILNPRRDKYGQSQKLRSN
jgi:hypothetical protein